MAYQFCPCCGAIHRRVSRECRTDGCSSRTIIATKNMQALAQRFSDCDFNILAATSSISATADKTYTSVHLSIEFTEFYDIDKVFVFGGLLIILLVSGMVLLEMILQSLLVISTTIIWVLTP